MEISIFFENLKEVIRLKKTSGKFFLDLNWNLLKGIGGRWVNNLFHNLILFYRILYKLQDAFYRFLKFKVIFEIQGDKSR